MSNTSLSMGLDAIFGADKSSQGSNLNFAPISLISPSQYQPRKHFSESELKGLGESILENGILQPLLVREYSGGFELIAGERRLRAAKRVGLTEVPIIVCENINEQTVLAYGLIENIQREDLNAIEEAEAYQRLLDEFSLSHAELSKRVGKSRSHVSNMLRLINLSDAVKQYLIHQEISMGHARALLAVPEDQQIRIAERVIEESLSVRQTELLVKSILNTSDDRVSKFTLTEEERKKIDRWNDKLAKKFSTSIRVLVSSKGECKILLSTESIDTLESVVNELTNSDLTI